MKLTIGMIVKNEERYLRRCLEAIAHVLQQVDSELIIADTGSTDHTVEIAKEFTDNVFFFQWINDFSAARNAVLNRAKGEWFMTLDADEIFDNTDEIIAFFNGGEYKLFNSATYIQRNSNYKDYKVYSDFQVLRMTKVFHETHYINAIHERIEPFRQPTKHLNAIVKHYGYVKEENLDCIDQKCRRNEDIILSELKNDPTNSKMLYDLAKTYALSGNDEKSFEYYSKALKYAIEKKSIMQLPIYLNIAVYYYSKKNYSDSLNIINIYFKSKSISSVFDLEMFYLLGYIYFELEKYDDSIDSFKKYLHAYKEYKRGKYQGNDLYLYECQNANIPGQINAIIMLARAYTYINDYEAANNIIRTVPKEDLYYDKKNSKPLIQLELSIMRKVDNFSRLPALLEFLQEDDFELLQDEIEKELHHNVHHKSVLTEFSNTDAFDYAKLMNLRYKSFYGNGIIQQDIDRFIVAVDSWSPIYADVLYWAICYNCNIQQISEKFDIFDLEYYLLNKNLHYHDLSKCVIQHIRAGSANDIYSNLWRSILCYMILPSKDLSNDEIITMYYCYAEFSYSYLNAAYREEILNDAEPYLFPEPIRVGYYFYLAHHTDNSTQKISFIRNAVKLYPQIADAAKIILAEIQRVMNDNATHNSEFDQYAAIIKENIYVLINSNRIAEALKLIDSYEQLCPSDQDIPELKKAIVK
jgi:glycosyltransferase involved in cell wall biosynthesis